MQDYWPTDKNGKYQCCVCKQTMPADYQPEQACCSGYQCGCQGLPDWPAVCSQACNDQFLKGQRMKNATITELFSVWLKQEKEIDQEVITIGLAGVTNTHDFHDKLSEKFGDAYPNHWYKAIAHPIAEQIKQAGGFEKVEVLGPFGIGARISFHCYKQADDALEKAQSLTIEPFLGDNETVPLRKVDYSVNTGEFKKDTIGERNGMNCALIDIDPSTQGQAWLSLLDKKGAI